ncbi:MAG TPA: NB-ARC domain-containing protein, partial [Thermoanaerobaculia bacterium]|nr:NB-ARC domain-containing protein [Thermoanaerobaculia bacterium]
MRRYDAFLAHNQHEQEAARFIASRLRSEGLVIFLDEHELVPGTRLPTELGNAIFASQAFLVLIGPNGVGGYQEMEIDTALHRRTIERSFRIIVLELPGADSTALSPAARSHLSVPLTSDLQSPEAIAQIVAAVRGTIPDKPTAGPVTPKYRSMAPPIDGFVKRAELEAIVALLVRDGDGRHRETTTVGLTTGLRGAGGFGKTALAQAVCEDLAIRERFTDGILWTTLGQDLTEAARLDRVMDLLRWWTKPDPQPFETVETAAAALRRALSGQKLLLVVDDVWLASDLQPFTGIARPAALLVTTRNSRSLPLDSRRVVVDALEVPQAVELLTQNLEPIPAAPRLERLARRLGEWPILLKLVNAQLREEYSDHADPKIAFDAVERALDHVGLTAFDSQDDQARATAVRRTVEASLKRLKPDDRRRYESLALFPEDQKVPLDVLELLWALGSTEVYRQCRRLAEMSLLFRFDPNGATIELHDVMRTYLVEETRERLR